MMHRFRAFGARGRTRWALVAAAIVALATPAAAYAWSQTYVSNTYFNADGIGLSAFNGSLNYNEMYWQPPYDPGGQAGPHYGQVTLCDSGYHCYNLQGVLVRIRVRHTNHLLRPRQVPREEQQHLRDLRL